MKKYWSDFQVWIPFVFILLLCGMTLLPYFSGKSEMFLGAFISFLPVAFLFAAAAAQHKNRILEKRIADLEAKLKSQN
jgi:biotin transporter BioY